jgi:hypothetical protein
VAKGAVAWEAIGELFKVSTGSAIAWEFATIVPPKIMGAIAKDCHNCFFMINLTHTLKK